MKRPQIEDHRRITLEKVRNPEYIPFLGGRPKRHTVIQAEDISNLLIALHTSRSFVEFLKSI
jgi:hypothetical protein